ncbi:hypothetical protein IWQ60_012321, partial [Tieghemiomyces parasiticus]
ARLVAVSKTKPVDSIQAAYDIGQRHFGENYLQELVEKSRQLPQDIRWHYIGQLQTNKCKALAEVPNLWAIETIDSVKRARALNTACQHRSAPLNIFVQVNTSQEENKGGIPVTEAKTLCRYVLDECPQLHLLGLMTIGSVEHSGQIPNPDFQLMAKLQADLSRTLGRDLELSMGMSHDYQHALEMGATNVRVGSSIFGARAPKV